MLVKSQKYDSIKCMTSVNQCLTNMTAYLDAMIDNVDMYFGSGIGIHRKPPSGVYSVSSAGEIIKIDELAIKCIEIIDSNPK